jgi:hypothetical protein
MQNKKTSLSHFIITALDLINDFNAMLVGKTALEVRRPGWSSVVERQNRFRGARLGRSSAVERKNRFRCVPTGRRSPVERNSPCKITNVRFLTAIGYTNAQNVTEGRMVVLKRMTRENASEPSGVWKESPRECY